MFTLAAHPPPSSSSSSSIFGTSSIASTDVDTSRDSIDFEMRDDENSNFSIQHQPSLSSTDSSFSISPDDVNTSASSTDSGASYSSSSSTLTVPSSPLIPPPTTKKASFSFRALHQQRERDAPNTPNLAKCARMVEQHTSHTHDKKIVRGLDEDDEDVIPPQRSDSVPSMQQQHHHAMPSSIVLAPPSLFVQQPSSITDLLPHQSSLPPSSSPSQIIRLEVGGKEFSTTLQTLLSIPNTYFTSYFSGNFSEHTRQTLKVNKNGEQVFFIDRDGTHFRYILNFLRDRTLTIGRDETLLREVLSEAKYYHLDVLVESIQSKLNEIVHEKIGTDTTASAGAAVMPLFPHPQTSFATPKSGVRSQRDLCRVWGAGGMGGAGVTHITPLTLAHTTPQFPPRPITSSSSASSSASHVTSHSVIRTTSDPTQMHSSSSASSPAPAVASFYSAHQPIYQTPLPVQHTVSMQQHLQHEQMYDTPIQHQHDHHQQPQQAVNSSSDFTLDEDF